MLAVLAVPALAAIWALVPGAALADSGDQKNVEVKVSIPQAEAYKVSDAQFRWGLNYEVTSGAHAGECNFLSAGVSPDAGSSHIWTEAEGFYSSSEGNTHIEKPNKDGTGWGTDSWAKKCQDGTGRKVGTAATETGTGAQVVIDRGEGQIDQAKGTAQISWKGSFSIVFYGGMTYWSLSDPVLTVANGKGTITATASGYAASREDTTRWDKLESRKITMATLPKVSLGVNGIVTTPAYQGVQLEGVDPAQSREESWWGSFPKDWVDYNQSTGQASYWYSSGGAPDVRKVATDVYINYTPDNSVIAVPIKAKPPVTDDSDDDLSSEEATPQADPSQNSGADGPAAGSGDTGSGAAAQQLVQNVLNSVLPASSVLTGMGTSVLEPAALATSTMNWLGKSLIPEAIDRVLDYKQPLLWSLAGLLALSSVAWIGFRHGWLVWPFSSKK